MMDQKINLTEFAALKNINYRRLRVMLLNTIDHPRAIDGTHRPKLYRLTVLNSWYESEVEKINRNKGKKTVNRNSTKPKAESRIIITPRQDGVQACNDAGKSNYFKYKEFNPRAAAEERREQLEMKRLLAGIDQCYPII